MRQLELASEWMSPARLAGNAGVIVSAALFLIAALALNRTVEGMQGFANSAERALGVLHESGQLVQAINLMNASSRVYLNYRNPAILVEREQSKRRIAVRFAHLRELLADDPVLRGIAGKAARLHERQVVLFDRMIAKAGAPGIPVIEGETERLQTTKGINAQFAMIRDRASASYFDYQRNLTEEMQLCVILALLAGIFAPVCGLVGVHLLRRESAAQEARELQSEMMHVQRLAIMGETSAMLAHEINQPLTAATNYLAVLRRQMQSGAVEKANDTAERIGQQFLRASAILKRLRRFIEKREDDKTAEAPEALVADASALLGTIDNELRLNTELGPGLPRVLVDRVQLQQVLVNLMRNAIEAMQGCARRELTLSVSTPDGESVEIALADTGPGLPPAVAEKLFQPFVSTKESGMGVGLSICKTIIEQHDGRIWAGPNPGGGTVFRFSLPGVKEQVPA